MAKRRGRTPALEAASLAILERALAKRRRDVERLQVLRNRLAARLADIEADLEAVRGAPAVERLAAETALSAADQVRRRRRAGGGPSLMEAITEVLKAATAPMRVAQVVRAVLAAGYRTEAKHFRAIVQMTLSKLATAKRVGRGLYAFTGAGPSAAEPGPRKQASRARKATGRRPVRGRTVRQAAGR